MSLNELLSNSFLFFKNFADIDTTTSATIVDMNHHVSSRYNHFETENDDQET